jgi:N-acetylglucosaminyldiphosphoundecaprenol N-acetyl-beta-D-mannosaminyltransferase
MEILDVRIDNLSHSEILEKIELFLSDDKFHQIATVNPEFILEAQKDAEFKDILNNSALNVADGIGIWFAFLRFGKLLKARIAGADLMHEILKIADEKRLLVFLAINKNGLSLYEEIKDALSLKYPDIQFFGEDIDPTATNYELQTISPWRDTAEAVANHKLLLCNFGAPQQEKFINSMKNDIIGVAIGVGGSFEFITGKIRRAPKIMRILGLEWLCRLILQPKRWKRIWNAVIVFPIKILFSKKQ